MTLYYSLVFALLMVEMGIFMLLILPLPFTWRKRMFSYISTSPLIAKLQYGMKITFIFILILFMDSVNRVYRVQRELADASNSNQRGSSVMGPERTEVQARKFYSQRNMYLCGFTLFLSLILNRTYTLILDILRLEQSVKEMRQSSNDNVRGSAGEKDIIAKKDAEIKAIKSQAEGLQREYSELADRYEALQKQGIEATPKKDI